MLVDYNWINRDLGVERLAFYFPCLLYDQDICQPSFQTKVIFRSSDKYCFKISSQKPYLHITGITLNMIFSFLVKLFEKACCFVYFTQIKKKW